MSDSVIDDFALGLPWTTFDPFLFCVHHIDHYPAGNDALGPAASLRGRQIGMDFEGKDGWRMYHGDVVPGFPRHPHRGFETVTVARRGYIDHSDSLGATARFGGGDVQWMTAGKGIVHSEMFPLLNDHAPNPAELFQIWLNLPSESKMVDPYFTMLWNRDIPHIERTDANGNRVSLSVIAGSFEGQRAPAPPPDSWASQSAGHVAIWTLRFEPRARFVLPKAPADLNRTLYFFQGESIRIDDVSLGDPRGLRLRPDRATEIENGPSESELLMLEGRPIAEPVVHYGPFVMNTKAEILQAVRDYQNTEFGGWPWSTDGPVHERARTRFARHADGRDEGDKG